MDINQAIKERHSVRKYLDKPIEEELRNKLNELVDEINKESGLHVQLICDEPGCFNSFLAHYGRFSDVKNYIALVGKESDDKLEEKCGYFGQKIVLEAQMMGLRTCWVGGTFSKGKCKAKTDDGEKHVLVITIGYGAEEGKAHKSKRQEQICDVPAADMPEWFKKGLEAAMLAPTAINQQKFNISLKGEDVIVTAGKGPFSVTDLGIVKYNFEAASGHKCL
ncbi:MAG: nitroreductase [Lachnospiraceae bacterium]|nr:nitroreductase [Lachnospiraceae bacterium]